MVIELKGNEDTVINKIETYQKGKKNIEEIPQEKLASFGITLMTRDLFKTFWRFFLTRGVKKFRKFVENRLANKVVKVINKANLNFAVGTLDIKNETEHKILQEQGFIPSKLVLQENSTTAKNLQRAHQAYQLTDWIKDDNHWIHNVLTEDQLQPFKNLSPEEISSSFVLDHQVLLDQLVILSNKNPSPDIKQKYGSQIAEQFKERFQQVGDDEEKKFTLIVNMSKSLEDVWELMPEEFSREECCEALDSFIENNQPDIDAKVKKVEVDKETVLDYLIETVPKEDKVAFQNKMKQHFQKFQKSANKEKVQKLLQAEGDDEIPDENAIKRLLPHFNEENPHLDPEVIKGLMTSVEMANESFATRFKKLERCNQWVGALNPQLEPEKKLAQSLVLKLGLEYLDEIESAKKELPEDNPVYKLFRYGKKLEEYYSPEVVAEGLRRYIDNSEESEPSDRLAAAGNHSLKGISMLFLSEHEEKIAENCFVAQCHKLAGEVCKEGEVAYSPEKQKFVDLLTAAMKNRQRLPENPKFVQKYLKEIIHFGLNFKNADKAVKTIKEKSETYDGIVSLDFEKIDIEFSKKEKKVINFLKKTLNTVQKRDVSYGDVLKKAETQLGPTMTTFLQAFIKGLLSPEKKGEVEKHLSKPLDDLAMAIGESEYSTLDKIIDKIPDDDLKELIKRGLEFQYIRKKLKEMSIESASADEDLDAMADNLKEQIKQRKNGEVISPLYFIAKSFSEPNSKNFTIEDAFTYLAKPIQRFGEQVQEARGYKNNKDDGTITGEVTVEAHGFIAVFAMQVIPDVIKVLKSPKLIKFGQTTVGKLLIRTFVSSALAFKKNLSDDEKNLAREAISAILDIVDLIDLSSDESKQHLQPYLKLLELIDEAVNGKGVSPDRFSKEFALHLVDVVIDIIKSGSAMQKGMRAVAEMPDLAA